MSKSTRKKVVSLQGVTSDMTRDRFMDRYQCCADNADVLSALVARQLPEAYDLAVRVHILNCQSCRSEYLKLKAELANEAASRVISRSSKRAVLEKKVESNYGGPERSSPQTERLHATSGEDAEFRELLKQLLSEQRSRDALLINPIFQRRLPSICQNFTRNAADADDLTNDVRQAVCDKMNQFEPQYDRPYGNFFGWVTRIARNKYIDDYRRRSARPEDLQLDELYAVEDVNVDIEAEAERHEAVERFWAFVGKLDELTQKIMHYHLEDNSLREIQEKLAGEGISLSYVAIDNIQRKVVADFLTSEDTRIAAMIAQKGEYLSHDWERDDPSTRKTGS